MKFFLVFLFSAASLAASAQTHALLRKSIGGNVDLPERAGADFGLPDWIEYRKIDSLIRLSDSTTLISIATFRRSNPDEKGTLRYRSRNVIYDPALARRQPLDSLRAALRARFGADEVGDIKFVGFSSERPVSKKRRTRKEGRPPTTTPRRRSEPIATVARKDDGNNHAPLFAGGTALFTLALCSGIVSLYRRSGNPA